VFDAMGKMEAMGARWACVVNSERIVSAVITQGDIRRHMLSGGSLDANCLIAAKNSFFSLDEGVSDAEIISALTKFDFVPIIDPNSGVLVDVATGSSLHSIPILEPNLGQLELAKLNEVFLSGWISSKSPAVTGFENKIEEFTGLRNCLAVSNGTVAIHLALEALGIGYGDEVIVPDLTFAATANAVLQAGATPVFVDVENESLGLDFELIKAAVTERTKAIVLVHLYGFPARDYILIHEFCVAHELLLIEDCAEALGTYSLGDHVGSRGDAATFSFFGNKLLTTGEGGAVTFRDASTAQRARVLRDHGQSSERRYFHEVAGFNYRLTGLQAAIGLGQFERISELLGRKKDLAKGYRHRLEEEPEISWLDEKSHGESSHWLNVMKVDFSSFRPGVAADFLMKSMAQEGIELRPVFYPLHVMPPYRDFQIHSFQPETVSNHWHDTAVCLPSSTTLSDSELGTVTQSIRSLLRNLRA
jgi:perosamine synthetase